MSTLEKIGRTPNIDTRSNRVVCVRNHGHEIDLKLLHVYKMVPDDNLEFDDIRVVDETGEDYIYPVSYFVSAGQIENPRLTLHYSHL